VGRYFGTKGDGNLNFRVDAKEFREALEDCMLKGKYYDKSSNLGQYIYLEASKRKDDLRFFELRIWNADMSTIVMCAIPATPLSPTDGLLLDSKIVFDTANTNGFLKGFGDTISFRIERGRLCIFSEDTDLSISLVNEHPYESSIDMVKNNSMPLSSELQVYFDKDILPSFGKTYFETALEVDNKEFSSTVQMAERIGTGFKLSYYEDMGLAISADSNSQNFKKTITPLVNLGDDSIVEISAPIYKFFNESFWLFLKDESPVFACSSNRILIRAPRIN
jgi:hypothetical protein